MQFSVILMPTGKKHLVALPYSTAGLILKGKNMDTALNPLLALLERAEVANNIEAEALRKAKVKEQTARAMDRATNEWR